MTLQAVSDRLEIQQLAVDYAHAIDSRDFDLLDDVFLPDAFIDYRAVGGRHGRYPDIKQWLKEVLTPVPAYQHLLGNFDLRIEGDTGRGRIMCLNPMGVPAPETPAGVRLVFYGVWYVDTYERTPKGWRIATRSEDKAFDPAGTGQ